METHLFWGQKVKGQGYEAQEAAGVGFGTLVSASFFYSSGFFCPISCRNCNDVTSNCDNA